MATEHTFTLKAMLDDADVQQKLNSLQQSAGGSGSSGVASSIDKIGSSLKSLRHALGGATVARSFLNLAKSAELFGDKTDQIVNQVQSSMNSLFGAMATGNVAVIAFTVALEALNIGLAKAQNEAAEAIKAEEEQRAAWRTLFGEQRKYIRSGREKEIDQLVAGGNIKALTAERDKVDRQRQETDAKLQKALYGSTGTEKYRADIAPNLSQTLSQLNKDFERLDEALKKVQKAEDDRVAGLDKARKAFQTEEADYTAKQNTDFEYFKKVMDDAAAAMSEATTAEQFRDASSRYTSARDWFETTKEKYEPTAATWAKQLQSLVTTSASSFGAAGFGMGEDPSIDIQQTISNQIDTVIRYMQDLIRKDLEVVNQTMTI